MLHSFRDWWMESATKLQSFHGTSSHISGRYISKLAVHLSSSHSGEGGTQNEIWCLSFLVTQPLLYSGFHVKTIPPVPVSTAILILCSLQGLDQCFKHLRPWAPGLNLTHYKYSNQVIRTKSTCETLQAHIIITDCWKLTPNLYVRSETFKQ